MHLCSNPFGISNSSDNGAGLWRILSSCDRAAVSALFLKTMDIGNDLSFEGDPNTVTGNVVSGSDLFENAVFGFAGPISASSAPINIGWIFGDSGGGAWQYNFTVSKISSVPIPAGGLLLLTGLGGITALRRRKKHTA